MKYFSLAVNQYWANSIDLDSVHCHPCQIGIYVRHIAGHGQPQLTKIACKIIKENKVIHGRSTRIIKGLIGWVQLREGRKDIE